MPEETHHVPTNAVLYARAPSNAELLLFDKFVITPLTHNIDAEFPIVSSDTDRLFGVAQADRALINYLEEQGIVSDVRPGPGVPLHWPNARLRATRLPDTLEQMEDFAQRMHPDTMTALPDNIGALTVRLWALVLQRFSQEPQAQAAKSFVPIYDRMCPVLRPTPSVPGGLGNTQRIAGTITRCPNGGNPRF